MLINSHIDYILPLFENSCVSVFVWCFVLFLLLFQLVDNVYIYMLNM